MSDPKKPAYLTAEERAALPVVQWEWPCVKPMLSPSEFARMAREAGHDSFGILQDPEALQALEGQPCTGEGVGAATTCKWYDEDTVDDPSGCGPETCEGTATHYSCCWAGESPNVCEKHKCRCKQKGKSVATVPNEARMERSPVGDPQVEAVGAPDASAGGPGVREQDVVQHPHRTQRAPGAGNDVATRPAVLTELLAQVAKLTEERDIARAARKRCRKAWKRLDAYKYRRSQRVRAEKRQQWYNLKEKLAKAEAELAPPFPVGSMVWDLDDHGKRRFAVVTQARLIPHIEVRYANGVTGGLNRAEFWKSVTEEDDDGDPA